MLVMFLRGHLACEYKGVRGKELTTSEWVISTTFTTDDRRVLTNKFLIMFFTLVVYLSWTGPFIVRREWILVSVSDTD